MHLFGLSDFLKGCPFVQGKFVLDYILAFRPAWSIELWASNPRFAVERQGGPFRL